VLQPEEVLGDTIPLETGFRRGTCDSEKEKWRSDFLPLANQTGLLEGLHPIGNWLEAPRLRS